jgi:hypothetical protein
MDSVSAVALARLSGAAVGAGLCSWSRVAVAVLVLLMGHAAMAQGDPLDQAATAEAPITGKVSAYWKTKEDFLPTGIPRSLLDLLPDYGTLTQGKWNERETFEYRHAINAKEGLFGCLASLRNMLFVGGSAVIDPRVLPPDDKVDWISPDDPLVLLENPRFQRKL